MGIKKFNPVTSTLRFKTVSDFKDLTNIKSLKRLTKGLTKKAGRNSLGRITVRRKGGGQKRKYRIIDFKRNKLDIKGKIATIEYDPNRSARIALVYYEDGEKRYILHPHNLKVGSSIISTKNVDHSYKIHIGNCFPILSIPVGTIIHNIELTPGKGGQIVRSAGTSGQVVSKDDQYCYIKLPSGEVRKILGSCIATIGQVSNLDHEKIVIGKAGRSRWLNKRPKVRGVAMNPIDHPHGGGEGRSSGGRHPVTPWGKGTKGNKTRYKKKISNKYIIQKKRKKSKRK